MLPPLDFRYVSKSIMLGNLLTSHPYVFLEFSRVAKERLCLEGVEFFALVHISPSCTYEGDVYDVCYCRRSTSKGWRRVQRRTCLLSDWSRDTLPVTECALSTFPALSRRFAFIHNTVNFRDGLSIKLMHLEDTPFIQSAL